MMLQGVIQLYQLLPPIQKKQLIRLQLLVIVMAFFEVLGLAAIAPFMALIADNRLLESNAVLHFLYLSSGLQEPRLFMLLAGGTVLATLLLGAMISSYTVWRLSCFAANLGAWISEQLYHFYLYQPWLFHTQTSSSLLSKQIATEANRVTHDILHPLVQMTGRIVLGIFILLALLFYSPFITIMGTVLFAGAYLVLFYNVRRTLHHNGRVISQGAQIRYRLMQEGFGGIKDLILLQRRHHLYQQFSAEGYRMADAQGSSMALILIPRYVIELITFGGIIALILLLVLYRETELSALLPLLSVYALAGFKLLPTLQYIYSQAGHIRANLSALEAILPDLQASQTSTLCLPSSSSPISLSLTKNLAFDHVSVTYPGQFQAVLKDIHFSFNAYQTIGIVGASGAGKSTLIDLLLGIIPASQGQVLLDDQPLLSHDIPRWQASLGYVSQHIFLTDASIASNVGLALPLEQLDLQKVSDALEQAQLLSWVNSLPQGIHTPVGEQGVQLSGGQRQRIGIARALYQQASTLIFDEATSALDGMTESALMEAIYRLSGKKTIVIITHRLQTLIPCDRLFLLDKGQLIDQGRYQELIASNSLFRRMVQHGAT